METLLNMLFRHMEGQETPYSTIILRSFQQIERTPELKRQYDLVCDQYPSGKHYVNPHIAQEIKKRLELQTTGVRHMVTNETKLINSYSELRR